MNHFENFKVMPWIGGVYELQAYPASKKWRKTFVDSILKLLKAHPRFAGIHLNIEPMPSGNKEFLALLKEIKQALPPHKIFSLAAYPPPTLWHPHESVHWDQNYYHEIAQHVDQLVPMMYDTAIQFPKFYQQLMSKWTQETLLWSGDTEVLLGLPLYDDHGVGYHEAKVENLANALQGINSGLDSFSTLPSNYRGIALYCEWEMDSHEWKLLDKTFLNHGPNQINHHH